MKIDELANGEASLSEGALSNRQQKLLCRYFDGECTVFQYWKVRRFLTKSATARAYVRELKQIEGIVCERSDDLPQIDLWGRISARIEAEENAEIFLGGREGSQEAGFVARMGDWLSDLRSGLTWAAGGASLASVCAFGLVYSGIVGRGEVVSGYNQDRRNKTPAASVISSGMISSGGSLAPIALNQSRSPLTFEREAEIAGTDFDTGERSRRSPFTGSPLSMSPLSRAQRVPNAFEIDWVRSEGRLHLLQDPGEKTAIIWVKPRQQASNAFATSRTSKRFPRSSSLPIAVPVAGR